jgi:GDP-4-dehydro-6-deoxy-D-mannose reductase
VNVLEAIRASGLRPRVLLIGSSEEYGARTSDKALDESEPLSPSNPYAITKACQEEFGLLYTHAYGIDIVMTRSFNHIGPGQHLGFVVPDFCSSIVAIERAEAAPILKVGNLEAIRDFTDVRDVVRAYRFILERGSAGEVYNVGSGKGTKIARILTILVGLSTVPLTVEVDPLLYRPNEVISIIADIGKITQQTEWKPEISIETSLQDALEACRSTKFR